MNLFIRQDLQDYQDYFLFFLTSQMEVRKPNPPAAEFFLFIFAIIYNSLKPCLYYHTLF